MCKYCENIQNADGEYIEYLDNNYHYIAYCKKTKFFELWSSTGIESTIIQYCPWCGCKLEPAVESETDQTNEELIAETLDLFSGVLNRLTEDNRMLARHEYIDSLETLKELKRRLKM